MVGDSKGGDENKEWIVFRAAKGEYTKNVVSLSLEIKQYHYHNFPVYGETIC